MRRSPDKSAESSSVFPLLYPGRHVFFFLADLENLLAHYHSITQLLMPEIRGHISQKMAETDKDRKRRDCGVDVLQQADDCS